MVLAGWRTTLNDMFARSGEQHAVMTRMAIMESILRGHITSTTGGAVSAGSAPLAVASTAPSS